MHVSSEVIVSNREGLTLGKFLEGLEAIPKPEDAVVQFDFCYITPRKFLVHESPLSSHITWAVDWTREGVWVELDGDEYPDLTVATLLDEARRAFYESETTPGKRSPGIDAVVNVTTNGFLTNTFIGGIAHFDGFVTLLTVGEYDW